MAGNINSSISNLESFANRAMSDARNIIGRASQWDTGSPHIPDGNFSVSRPSMERPPSIGDMLKVDTSEFDLTKLNTQAEAWFKKFFPNLAATLEGTPEEWAVNILNGNLPMGKHREALEAGWQIARDRIEKQGTSSEKQIDAEYSMRGFSLPSGAMMASKRMIKTQVNEQLAEVTLQQAVKDSDIILQLINFAATTATQLKTALMQLNANLLSTAASLAGRDPSAEKMRARAQAYSAYISGLSTFYNVELGFEQLRVKAEEARISSHVARDKLKADNTAKGVDSRNAALGNVANGFASAAGVAISSQSTLQAELFSGILGN